MTVVCDILQCPFNKDRFCRKKLLDLRNGYCLHIIDKHGRPRVNWMDAVDDIYKEGINIEDGYERVSEGNDGSDKENDGQSAEDCGCSDSNEKDSD